MKKIISLFQRNYETGRLATAREYKKKKTSSKEAAPQKVDPLLFIGGPTSGAVHSDMQISAANGKLIAIGINKPDSPEARIKMLLDSEYERGKLDGIRLGITEGERKAAVKNNDLSKDQEKAAYLKGWKDHEITFCLLCKEEYGKIASRFKKTLADFSALNKNKKD